MVWDMYSDPWAKLAAAIIHSGEQHNDKAFLEGDWCDTLKLICKMDIDKHSGVRAQINVNSSQHTSKE